MRNLVNFVWKHHFTVLFLLLEVVAFFLLVQNNSFHQSNFLNFSSAVGGNAYFLVDNITDYFQLKEQNEQLNAENAALKSASPNSQYGDYEEHFFVQDTSGRMQYLYFGAKVVNSSTNKRNNYLILNQGYSNGIKPEMGVIGPEGVVGIVKEVSANYCSVISVLHSNIKISSLVQKNDYFGILEWPGYDADKARLMDIPWHVDLAKGDTIVTRGSSTIFPKGIMVGYVEDFKKIPGSNFYDTEIRLATNFSNISYVYVVKNMLREEQQELEEKLSDE